MQEFAHKNQKYITEFKSELSNKKFSIYQISLDENPRMAWNEQTHGLITNTFKGFQRGLPWCFLPGKDAVHGYGSCHFSYFECKKLLAI